MNTPIVYRLFSPLSAFCRSGAVALFCVLGHFLGPLSARAQEAFQQPDYSKFEVESGPITLEVWSWVEGLDKAAEEFERMFPNIKVEAKNIGSGPVEYQKVQTVIKAGSGGPDIAQIEFMLLPSFIVTDGLADLSKYGAREVKSYFIPWTWAQVSPDGNAIYGIPQDSGPMALLYNKRLFDQYELSVPTTWDEFAQQAEKLAKASNGKVKLANFTPTHAPWWMGLVWASGGEFFRTQGDSWVQTLDNPASEKVLSYWDDLVKKNLVGQRPGFTTELFNAIANGEIAAALEAAWGSGVLASSLNNRTAGEWRVAPLPQWTKDQPLRSGNWGGSCNVVLKQSKHPKAAALFCIWLNTAKAPIVANWNNFGLFPAALAGLKTPDLNQPEKNPGKFCGGQNVAEIYAQASEAVNPDFAWAPWFAFVNDNYNKHIEALFSGKVPVKQALKAWQNESLKNARADGYEVKEK